ncbi:hypothetical protein V8G54_029120 [Vigna mungo]|uniref:Uncharacterized protein n=1 Tax=Vigna mungo TaxID=3915 RepID=A0AAQ3MSR3_VIGMU
MDFITSLPISQGYTVIMVVIDRLSKYAHFCPLKADYNNKQVAEAFVKTVIKLHGFPKTIVSDRDKVFSDGQSEALNKCLEMYLRCYTYESPKEWVKFLPWAEFWYNIAYDHNSLMTPFKHMDFQIGDMMLVKLQPYRQNSVALRKNQKLSMKYFGPFPIIGRIGFVAYKLLLPPTAKIHPVFHCSQLKPCRGDHTQQYVLAITIDFETPPVIQPAAMLQDRQIMQGNKIIKQFLIQWEGLEESTPTWEDESALRKAYPTFNLEDKVNFKGGGIVTREDHENVRVEETHGSRCVRKKNIRLNDYDWAGVH